MLQAYMKLVEGHICGRNM